MAKYADIIHTLFVLYVTLEDGKIHGQRNTGQIYTTIHEKYYMNIEKYYMNMGLLKHDFRFSASRILKAMFKVPTLSFHAGIALYMIGAVYHNFVTQCSSRCKSAY